MLPHSEFQNSGLKKMVVKGPFLKVVFFFFPVHLVNLHILVNESQYFTSILFGLTDQEYMEFLEFLAKPVENLPSAEVQLERREAERSGQLNTFSIIKLQHNTETAKVVCFNQIREQVSDFASCTCSCCERCSHSYTSNGLRS